MLISTSDFALIDELSQASSSVFSSPKHRQIIPSKSTMLLKYVDDSCSQSSCPSQFSFINTTNNNNKKSITKTTIKSIKVAESKFEKINISKKLVLFFLN